MMEEQMMLNNGSIKHLINFWRTLEISTQDNAKLLPQLNSGFKRTIRWNKYLSKPELLAQN